MIKSLYLKLIVFSCSVALITVSAEANDGVNTDLQHEGNEENNPVAAAVNDKNTGEERNPANKLTNNNNDENNEVDPNDDKKDKKKLTPDGTLPEERGNEQPDGRAPAGERRDEGISEPPSSGFVLYFVLVSIFVVGGYIGYSRRKKIMGVLVEGWRKKEQRQVRRGGGGHGQAYNRVSESEPLEDA